MCFYYDEQAEMYEESTVKVRKSHRCKGCGKQIKKGSTATASSGRFDGAFFRSYTCDKCERMICSIAAEEIGHGCAWHEAWCSPSDLKEYMAERTDPVALLPHATIAECKQHVATLWSDRRVSAGYPPSAWVDEGTTTMTSEEPINADPNVSD